MGHDYSDMDLIRGYLSNGFNSESALLIVSLQRNDLRRAEEAARMISEIYAALERVSSTLKEENSRLIKENDAILAELNHLKEENAQLKESAMQIKRRKVYDVERIMQLYLETHSYRKVAIATGCSAKTVKSILIEQGMIDDAI